MSNIQFECIKWEPRDIWLGVYWTRAVRITSLVEDIQRYRVYVCLLPCLPIIFTFEREIPLKDRHKNW